MCEFENTETSLSRHDIIKQKLREHFDGKIVRKDLTKKMKEGANVPVYVLEFLLGQYCSSDDEEVVEEGVNLVKRILADNFVRPDESQKILSQLRKKGSHTIIDMVTVHLDMNKNCFFADFSNLGVGGVPIDDAYPEKYDRLLCGGIWCIVQLDYESDDEDQPEITDEYGNPLRSKKKKNKDHSPISIRKLTPIQMPHIDIDELKTQAKKSIKDDINVGTYKLFNSYVDAKRLLTVLECMDYKYKDIVINVPKDNLKPIMFRSTDLKNYAILCPIRHNEA